MVLAVSDRQSKTNPSCSSPSKMPSSCRVIRKISVGMAQHWQQCSWDKSRPTWCLLTRDQPKGVFQRLRLDSLRKLLLTTSTAMSGKRAVRDVSCRGNHLNLLKRHAITWGSRLTPCSELVGRSATYRAVLKHSQCKCTTRFVAAKRKRPGCPRKLG